MNLKLTQSQARLLKECIKLYDTQLLTSSEDWRDYDKLFEKLAVLCDTSRDDDFSYNSTQHSDKSYWINKHNPWKDDSNKRVGKDMDLL